MRRTIGRALAGRGYVEVVTIPFVSGSISEHLLLDENDGRRPSVRIANPISDEEPYLRPTLLPGLLAALARNVGRGLSDAAIFEWGPVFRAGPDTPTSTGRLPVGVRPTAEQFRTLQATLPQQPTHLAVALTGAREPVGWWGPARPATWADAIEAARIVAGAVGVELEIEADQHAPWHPGRCAALRVGAQLVGHAGELHPRAIDALGLPPRTVAMELRLDSLFAAATGDPQAPAISVFPPASFDLALVVDDGQPAGAVSAAVREGAGPLLEDARLFDVYTGSQVGEGRKSLAFAVRLRAPDRTLTADEVAAAREGALTLAAERCGAVLRS
jgi:phenylalanyl-tRNA synthetase beta chain